MTSGIGKAVTEFNMSKNQIVTKSITPNILTLQEYPQAPSAWIEKVLEMSSQLMFYYCWTLKLLDPE